MASPKKQCSKCSQLLPLDSFRYQRGTCKACETVYKQQWRKSGGRQKEKDRAKANPILTQTASMLSGAKARAKEKQLPFDLDLNYLRSISPSHCPIFGTPLAWSTYRGHCVPASPSLDRIIPERGYVKGNVWIISHRANAIKNDASHEELRLVTEAVGKAIVDSLEF